MTRIEIAMTAALLATLLGVPVDVARLVRAATGDEDKAPTIRPPRLGVQ